MACDCGIDVTDDMRKGIEYAAMQISVPGLHPLLARSMAVCVSELSEPTRRHLLSSNTYIEKSFRVYKDDFEQTTVSPLSSIPTLLLPLGIDAVNPHLDHWVLREVA
jgi:hypothetical protein